MRPSNWRLGREIPRTTRWAGDWAVPPGVSVAPRYSAVLQGGHGGATDQGGEAGGEDDAALLPSVPLEPGAAGAEPAGVWKLKDGW